MLFRSPVNKKVIAITAVIVVLTAFQICPGLEPWQIERDHICMLAAYSLVCQNWTADEDTKTDPIHAYNVGCIICDKNSSKIVWAGMDRVDQTKDETEHAVTRSIQEYIANMRCILKDVVDTGVSVDTISTDEFVLYTTLEPCAQDSGMMVQLGIKRVVYGQSDPIFGKVIQRLQNGLNEYKKTTQERKGYYPIQIAIEQDGKYGTKLDEDYKKFIGSNKETKENL